MTTTTDTERLDWLMTHLTKTAPERLKVDLRVTLEQISTLNSRAAIDRAMLTEALTRTPLLSIAELNAALGAVNFTKPFRLEPPEACCPAASTGDLPLEHPSNEWVVWATMEGLGAYKHGKLDKPLTPQDSAYGHIVSTAYGAAQTNDLRAKLDDAVLERTDAEADCEKAEANLRVVTQSLDRYRRMVAVVRGASSYLTMAIETLGEGTPS